MKRLLVVVDFQNDFVKGPLGFEGAQALEDRIVEKIKEYREGEDEIVFTFDTHDRDYLETMEGAWLPIEHCIEGTEGWKPYGKVASMILDADQVFEKPSFGSVDFMKFLTRRQEAATEAGVLPFSSIEFVGLVSNICILSNAILAKTACPEVPVIVDARCTDAADKEIQEKAFDVLQGVHVEVRNRV